jgi:ABC-2 type transport system permease protein
VSARATTATALRVLGQLRRDPRTLALLIVVPAVLVCLLRWLFDEQQQTFDRIGALSWASFPSSRCSS